MGKSKNKEGIRFYLLARDDKGREIWCRPLYDVELVIPPTYHKLFDVLSLPTVEPPKPADEVCVTISARFKDKRHLTMVWEESKQEIDFKR